MIICSNLFSPKFTTNKSKKKIKNWFFNFPIFLQAIFDLIDFFDLIQWQVKNVKIEINVVSSQNVCLCNLWVILKKFKFWTEFSPELNTRNLVKKIKNWFFDFLIFLFFYHRFSVWSIFFNFDSSRSKLIA